SVSPRGRRGLVARATTRQGRRLVVGRSRRAWIPDGDCGGAGPGAAPGAAVGLRLALGGATWRAVLSEPLIERRHTGLDGLGEDAQDHRRADRRLRLLGRGAGRAHAERQEGAGHDRGATAPAPGLIASSGMAIAWRPYSSSYSTSMVLPGSLPSFRTGTKPALSSWASAPPKMNPRDSTATTMSTRSF